jgi:molybdenum cofactor cytidylyltransferase
VFYAVVPAAGLSTRMGRPKLSLPFAGRTILEQVVLTLLAGGVQHVLVVTGPHTPELNSMAEATGADVLAIGSGTPDMRSTIEHGLNWLQRYKSPHPFDAFFVAPGDHPAFGASVVSRLCNAYFDQQSKSIIVPTHAGKRGHPVLIGWRHVQGIKKLAENRGVNAYLREKSEEVHELETGDHGILFNLDSSHDYAKLNSKNSFFPGRSST